MTSTTTAGPSAKDISSDPGLAPENMIRGESLHKASTDRVAADVVDGAGARDVFVIDAGTVFVRADSEDGAVAKFLNALGGSFDARDVKARQAKPADLLP